MINLQSHNCLNFLECPSSSDRGEVTVADPEGFHRTPLFQVAIVCSYIDRVYTPYARAQGVATFSATSGTPLFRFLDPPLGN